MLLYFMASATVYILLIPIYLTLTSYLDNSTYMNYRQLKIKILKPNHELLTKGYLRIIAFRLMKPWPNQLLKRNLGIILDFPCFPISQVLFLNIPEIYLLFSILITADYLRPGLDYFLPTFRLIPSIFPSYCSQKDLSTHKYDCINLW